MTVQCATLSKSLNPRNIDKSVSDIRIRIRFPFESSFWISLSGFKLTILPDIQPTNRIVIISDCHILRSRSSPDFLKLSPSPTTVQTIFKYKVQVHMTSKKLKMQPFHNKNFPFLFHQFSPNPALIRNVKEIYSPDTTQI